MREDISRNTAATGFFERAARSVKGVGKKLYASRKAYLFLLP